LESLKFVFSIVRRQWFPLISKADEFRQLVDYRRKKLSKESIAVSRTCSGASIVRVSVKGIIYKGRKKREKKREKFVKVPRQNRDRDFVSCVNVDRSVRCRYIENAKRNGNPVHPFNSKPRAIFARRDCCVASLICL